MDFSWDEVAKALVPVKDYEDLCHRLHQSLSYPCVRQAYNLTLPALISYTHKLLGGDARKRYGEYEVRLTGTMKALDQAGVLDVADLAEKTARRDLLETFTLQSKVEALSTVAVLKYLLYWFIPMDKYMSGLVQGDPDVIAAIKVLGEVGLRTNLAVLQAGLTPTGRRQMAQNTRLTIETITGLVHRADFSRLPWASKATISNIVGAGYASLGQLADANPEQLYADFFKYGERIGKNLKLGNEIENSYRIAIIIPRLIQE
jgi:Domain of unknown function (DUF4332)